MTSLVAEVDRSSDGRFAVLASDEIYRGPIFSVRTDTVVMPGGRSAQRDIVDHCRAVAVVALDDAGQVVLIEQYRHPLRRRVWEIPAGLMDVTGEHPLDCARRELAEEVGLAAEHWSVLVDIATSPGYSTEAVRIFLATGLRHTHAPERTDEEADMRAVRVPLESAVMAVMDGLIVNASAVAGLMAADRIARNTQLPASASTPPWPADDPWETSPANVSSADTISDAPAIGTDR